MWVFAYGSLMWNPEFAVAEQEIATLPAFRRCFCMWSIHHRGTIEQPGLVLALEPHGGAECTGLALRVADHEADDTLAALRHRELVSSAYVEKWINVELASGRVVQAVTYVVDTDHSQYTGELELAHQARVIAKAAGGRGRNRDYLENTVTHLAELKIEDPELSHVNNLVKSMPYS